MSIAAVDPAITSTYRPAAVTSAEPSSARRVATHPRLMLYRRLTAAVLVVNAAVAVTQRSGWRVADGSWLEAAAALTVVNIAAAVVVRQRVVLNTLYVGAGRVPTAAPLRLKRLVSKVHHVGGLHVGFAVAGTGWLVMFFGAMVVTRVRFPDAVTPATVVLGGVLVALFVTMTVCATQPVRMRWHNVFEMTHRWCGWIGVAVFWGLSIHLHVVGRGDQTVLAAMAGDWQVWTLAGLTACIAWPWLRLRRVPVTVHCPSRHAAIVEFDHGVRPDTSSGVGISRSPLREWHAFATVTTPGRPGFRLLVSRAGDWTGRFIDDPPDHLWVRGLPVTAPLATTSLLYRRVVYVTTGSGIGPALGQILADRTPALLVWSTRDPRRTYGDALVDEVMSVQPDARIWDTTANGAPDLLGLALDAVSSFGAEAVYIVSNKPTTLGLVHQLEARGIPAFGPIWDS